MWAVPSRSNPNAAALKDGAIQRMSVVPDRYSLQVKCNIEKVGFYKRAELNERASASAVVRSVTYDQRWYQDKIARIYYQQVTHTHNHPYNKQLGKSWIIEFESYGTYKSPLTFWASGTTDVTSKLQIKVPTLSAAVKYCELNGYGYDVQYS